MKELSIEEKANAYDKVLERVISFYQRCKECGADGTVVFLESTFPELAESKDERIRKWLVGYFNQYKLDGVTTFANGIEIDDIQDWLEKQSESDETKAKIFLISKGYPIDANGIFPTYEEMYNIIIEGLEHQGYRHEKQGEKKPAWTDNDRIMASTLMRDVDQIYYINEEGRNKRLEWLKSLEDRFNKEK